MAIDTTTKINQRESRPVYTQVDAGTGYTLAVQGTPTWTLWLGDPDDNVPVPNGSGNADVVIGSGTQKIKVGVWIDTRARVVGVTPNGLGPNSTTMLAKDDYTLVIDFDALGSAGVTNETKSRHYSRREKVTVE